MFPNGQLRFVLTEFVEHIGRVADGDGHDCGAIVRELIRGPTIKADPQAIAEGRWKGPGVWALARDGKALAIRGRKHAAAPAPTEGKVIMIVDQGGDGGLEGLLAQVPG